MSLSPCWLALVVMVLVARRTYNYLRSKGTEHRVTVHDTPEHNGVVERLLNVFML